MDTDAPVVDPFTVCVDLDEAYEGPDGKVGTAAHAEATMDLWRQAGLLKQGAVVDLEDVGVLCVYQVPCD